MLNETEGIDNSWSRSRRSGRGGGRAEEWEKEEEKEE